MPLQQEEGWHMKSKRAPEQNHKWTYYIDNNISRESANNLRASYIRTLVGAHTRARMWTITLYNKAMEERASRSSVVFHKIGCENRRPSQYCRVSENDQKAHRSTELKVFLALKKEGKHSTTSLPPLVVSSTLVSYSTASYVLYNRTARNRGFFIC